MSDDGSVTVRNGLIDTGTGLLYPYLCHCTYLSLFYLCIASTSASKVCNLGQDFGFLDDSNLPLCKFEYANDVFMIER